MHAPAPLLLVPAADPQRPSLFVWSEQVAQGLAGGARLLGLFGRPDADATVTTTAVLQQGDGTLQALRGHGPAAGGYPSITARHPAAQVFERELWEQTGLQPEGHPWLKPVRYEGTRQQQMAGHPFFSLRGQDVHEVGVGPIHASVIEPGHFRFMCHGETVHHLELQLGYQHRGVEALLLQRAPHLRLPLVESIAGDSSIAYAWACCAALEALTQAPAHPAAERVRGVALELERVAMHLAALTGLATDIAFLQGGATYGRLRTAIINATQRVCGNRFGRGWLRPGGVRHPITEALRRDLQATLAAFARDLAEVNALMLSARSVRPRLQGVGVVGAQAAAELGLTGLAARSSGLPLDLRVSRPGIAYGLYPVAAVTEDGGDCWARMRVRQREIDESLRWLRAVLDAPGLDDPLALAPPVAPGAAPLRPDTLCVSLCEGFRGPVLQALETGPEGQLLQHKVQDPSMANWFGLAWAMRGNDISDFPICNKSFDLSYCGNDL